MMMVLDMLLNDDTLCVITPDSRRAHYITAQYVSAVGKGVEAPQVFTLDEWLTIMFNSSTLDLNEQFLLSATQCNFLWESVIKRHEIDTETPLRPLIRSLVRSDSEFTKWDLQRFMGAFALFSESENYLTWRSEVREMASQRNYVLPVDLLDWLSQNAEAASFPKSVLFFGWLKNTPALTKLKTILEECGVKVGFYQEHHSHAHTLQLVRPSDDYNELTQAALWARAIATENPLAKIGIIVPQLNQKKSDLELALTTVLSPEAFWPGSKSHEPPYNIGASNWLGDHPMVRVGLSLFRCMIGQHDISVWESILLSPYIALPHTSRDQLHQFVKVLEKSRLSAWTSREIIRTAASSGYEDISSAISSITTLDFSGLKNTHGWSVCFQNVLNCWGWPGNEFINSHEYQVFTSIGEMLTQFSMLGSFTGEIRVLSAIRLLESCIAGSVYQFRSDAARIQVIDVMESVGFHFDYAFILGVDNQSWPGFSSGTAFLPVNLLKMAGAYGYVPSETTEFRLELCDYLKRIAPVVIFSCPVRNKQGDVSVFPSVLSLPVLDLGTDASVKDGVTFLSERYKALPYNYDVPQKGGTDVLRDTALCPAKAFYRHRLGCTTRDQSYWGLDPRDRSRLLHIVCDLFWRGVHNSSTLRATPDDEIYRLYELAWDEAVLTVFHGRIFQLPNALITIEKYLSYKLFINILREDLNRPDFEIVATEKKETLLIKNLQLNVCVDRIDRDVASGMKYVIDIKKYKSTYSEWLGDRPDDVQLPIYATCTADTYSGAIFACLTPEASFYNGVCEGSSFGQVVSPQKIRGTNYETWDQLTEKWREVIHTLVTSFTSTDCTPKPKNKATCDSCAFNGLCQV